MSDKGLLCTGATGSTIAAICCFTPALVLLLGALGLSAWLAWLDYVLLPALILFLGITIYALIRIQRARTGQARASEAP
jgi:mercuric ion transport protein